MGGASELGGFKTETNVYNIQHKVFTAFKINTKAYMGACVCVCLHTHKIYTYTSKYVFCM